MFSADDVQRRTAGGQPAGGSGSLQEGGRNLNWTMESGYKGDDCCGCVPDLPAAQPWKPAGSLKPVAGCGPGSSLKRNLNKFSKSKIVTLQCRKLTGTSEALSSGWGAPVILPRSASPSQRQPALLAIPLLCLYYALCLDCTFFSCATWQIPYLRPSLYPAPPPALRLLKHT